MTRRRVTALSASRTRPSVSRVAPRAGPVSAAIVAIGAIGAIGVCSALAACKDKSPPPPPPSDASRARRVLQPPPGEVRAVPPHAIHDKGVGPYTLGLPLEDVLELVPGVPRVVLTQIDNVVDFSLVRAEGDALLIGVKKPSGVIFVSVLEPEIAQHASGVGVGATVSELEAALGDRLHESGRAADPRIARFSGLPGARFLLDGERAAAVMVDAVDAPIQTEAQSSAEAQDAGVVPSSPTACDIGELRARAEAVVQAARLPAGSEPRGVVLGCFSGPGAEAIVYTEDLLIVVDAEAGKPDRLRREGSYRLPGLVYAAALDVGGDGRHQIAVVTESRTPELRTTRLELLRVEGGKWSRMASEQVYQVSAQTAAWVGASLEAIELLVELEVFAGGVRVGGLYVRRGEGGLRTVAPLSPTQVAVRRRRVGAALVPGTPPSLLGVQDAGADALGDAGVSAVRPGESLGGALRPGALTPAPR